MSVQGFITKSRFAQLAGVSVAAITKATRPGKSLAEAAVGEGRKMRVNPTHPAALAYLENRTGQDGPAEPEDEYSETVDIKPKTRRVGAAAARETRKQTTSYDVAPSDLPDNMRDFANMTIRQVVTKFGTDYRMVDYLRALKEIENIDANRVKNAKARGELVHRDLVTKGIIDPIDSAHRKMLTDGAKTIARRCVAMVGAGKSVDELEKFISGQITSFIKPAKARMRRTLDDVSTG